jgi:hypothetical protein
MNKYKREQEKLDNEEETRAEKCKFSSLIDILFLK